MVGVWLKKIKSKLTNANKEFRFFLMLLKKVRLTARNVQEISNTKMVAGAKLLTIENCVIQNGPEQSQNENKV